ncbi:hypothetical protein HRbin28_01242 [bacterium HR28]|nr:hypothetical protein HRbin28_01242 [bacterium HR28]
MRLPQVALYLATTVILLLAACQAGADTASEARLTAIPTQSPSSTNDVARPIKSTVRDSGAGGVTVEATWLGRQADGTIAIKLTLDTHSVDLTSFDVATNVTLRDERGTEVAVSSWQDERRDSHHRSGVVRFPALSSDTNQERVTLVVRNLAGVAERTLSFEFQR